MEYLVDSNVILDIFLQDENWFDWSAKTLKHYSDNHILVINPIIYGEISIRFSTILELEEQLLPQFFYKADIPWEACFIAGKCFQQYKKNNGAKNTILADFFIGAHAAVANMGLITRDVARYKTYFPRLEIIHP